MRLTCPNCGAQYEVPDEVIPNEGRDVQCSNCGDTWYQAHPGHPDSATEPAPEPVPAPERQLSKPATSRQPKGADRDRDKGAAAPDDAPVTHDDAPVAHEDAPVAHEGAEPAPKDSIPETQLKEIDAGISGILREEAEREARLRASEGGDPLESQPDLGLDDMSDSASQRARESRSRMAMMRGERASGSASAETGSRRELLPDIEDISSTLRSSDEDASRHTAIGAVSTDQPRKKRSGFARGFALVVIIGVIMALVYVNAPKITRAVPQADPVLSSYVAWVDQARVWLDAKLGEFTPAPKE